MREKPTECPICGSKVSRVLHGVTKKWYYKCSNSNCHFNVSEDYKDEEVALQGTKLTSKCIQCGEHLEVACGPHGLYPRCFNCDCDSKPTLVGNVVVSKWANAHSWNAKEEIKKLRKTFEENNNLNHSFDDYIADKQVSELRAEMYKGTGKKIKYRV